MVCKDSKTKLKHANAAVSDLPVNKFQRVRWYHRKTCKAWVTRKASRYLSAEEPTEEPGACAIMKSKLWAQLLQQQTQLDLLIAKVQGSIRRLVSRSFHLDEFRATMKSHIYKYLHRQFSRQEHWRFGLRPILNDRPKSKEERKQMADNLEIKTVKSIATFYKGTALSQSNEHAHIIQDANELVYEVND